VNTPIGFSRKVWALLLAGTIIVASSCGHVAAPHVTNFDKLAHFSIYGLLATLVARAWFEGPRMWWAVLILSFFGVTDEWHQSFTPGRSVEVLDWVADTSGALIAVVAYLYWGGYRRLLEWRLGRRQSRIEKRG
jgi:VanZ family protein